MQSLRQSIETKGKRDKHVIEKHAFMVTVVECHFFYIDTTKLQRGKNCVSHSFRIPVPVLPMISQKCKDFEGPFGKETAVIFALSTTNKGSPTL